MQYSSQTHVVYKFYILTVYIGSSQTVGAYSTFWIFIFSRICLKSEYTTTSHNNYKEVIYCIRSNLLYKHHCFVLYKNYP